jgi:hypothetical protein
MIDPRLPNNSKVVTSRWYESFHSQNQIGCSFFRNLLIPFFDSLLFSLSLPLPLSLSLLSLVGLCDSFQYSAGAQTRFCCGATTRDGHLVVGSKKGTINLYNAKLLEVVLNLNILHHLIERNVDICHVNWVHSFSKGNEFTKDTAKIGGVGSAPRAKTTLPGCGDPILGIDVTADGKWILATCKTYLLLIPASHPKGNLTGFQVEFK